MLDDDEPCGHAGLSGRWQIYVYRGENKEHGIYNAVAERKGVSLKLRGYLSHSIYELN